MIQSLIRILKTIPIMKIICEAAIKKLKFIIEVFDTVIRIAQLIRDELRMKESEEES